MKCSKCGSEIKPNTKFCENCGNPLMSESMQIKQESMLGKYYLWSFCISIGVFILFWIINYVAISLGSGISNPIFKSLHILLPILIMLFFPLIMLLINLVSKK